MGTGHHGHEHQEGSHHRKVWCALWCFAEETNQEDRGDPARQVHLRLLRKGCGEALSDWYLGVQGVPEGRCWGCLRHEHACGGDCALCYPSYEGADRRQVGETLCIAAEYWGVGSRSFVSLNKTHQ